MRAFSVFIVGLLFQTVISTCPQNSVPSADGEKCYFAVSSPMSALDAEMFCVNYFEGHLASVPNDVDNSDVVKAGMKTFGVLSQRRLWIGGTMGTDGQILWSDGSKETFRNFDTGEPSAATAAILIQLGGGKWKTINGHFMYPFMCESAINQSDNSSTAAPPQPSAQQVLPCEGPEWIYNWELQACYLILWNMTIRHMEEKCRAMGAHLASIRNEDENEFVEEITRVGLLFNRTVDGPSTQTALGAYRVNETTFAWYDGTPFEYKNWADGEPNNKYAPENCLEMYTTQFPANAPSEPYYQRWNDVNCYAVKDRNGVCKTPSKF